MQSSCSEYGSDWDIIGHNVLCDKIFKGMVCCGIFSAFNWLLTVSAGAERQRRAGKRIKINRHVAESKNRTLRTKKKMHWVERSDVIIICQVHTQWMYCSECYKRNSSLCYCSALGPLSQSWVTAEWKVTFAISSQLAECSFVHCTFTCSPSPAVKIQYSHSIIF